MKQGKKKSWCLYLLISLCVSSCVFIPLFAEEPEEYQGSSSTGISNTPIQVDSYAVNSTLEANNQPPMTEQYSQNPVTTGAFNQPFVQITEPGQFNMDSNPSYIGSNGSMIPSDMGAQNITGSYIPDQTAPNAVITTTVDPNMTAFYSATGDFHNGEIVSTSNVSSTIIDAQVSGATVGQALGPAEAAAGSIPSIPNAGGILGSTVDTMPNATITTTVDPNMTALYSATGDFHNGEIVPEMSAAGIETTNLPMITGEGFNTEKPLGINEKTDMPDFVPYSPDSQQPPKVLAEAQPMSAAGPTGDSGATGTPGQAGASEGIKIELLDPSKAGEMHMNPTVRPSLTETMGPLPERSQFGSDAEYVTKYNDYVDKWNAAATGAAPKFEPLPTEGASPATAKSIAADASPAAQPAASGASDFDSPGWKYTYDVKGNAVQFNSADGQVQVMNPQTHVMENATGKVEIPENAKVWNFAGNTGAENAKSSTWGHEYSMDGATIAASINSMAEGDSKGPVLEVASQAQTSGPAPKFDTLAREGVKYGDFNSNGSGPSATIMTQVIQSTTVSPQAEPKAAIQTVITQSAPDVAQAAAKDSNYFPLPDGRLGYKLDDQITATQPGTNTVTWSKEGVPYATATTNDNGNTWVARFTDGDKKGTTEVTQDGGKTWVPVQTLALGNSNSLLKANPENAAAGAFYSIQTRSVPTQESGAAAFYSQSIVSTTTTPQENASNGTCDNGSRFVRGEPVRNVLRAGAAVIGRMRGR